MNEQAPETNSGGHRGNRRLIAAYGAVVLLMLLILVGILVLSSDSPEASHGNPHLNLTSGITSGVPPDARPGADPPPLPHKSAPEAARAAGCELRLHLPDEGHQHIPVTAPEPGYKTKPPTSGNHIDEQQADGAYRATPRPVQVVHSLEHGRMAIQYQPDLPEGAQAQLIGLYGTLYGGTLLLPNAKMPFAVAATTWTNLLGCHSYRGAATLAAIAAFGRSTWGKYGGEPLTGLMPNAPTPTSP